MSSDLETPLEVERDEKAHEILRAWVRGDKTLWILFLSSAFKEPGTWGILLADLTRHICNSFVAAGKNNPLEQIVERYNEEITEPTSDLFCRIQRDQ